jgi:hypothetical protein
MVRKSASIPGSGDLRHDIHTPQGAVLIGGDITRWPETRCLLCGLRAPRPPGPSGPTTPAVAVERSRQTVAHHLAPYRQASGEARQGQMRTRADADNGGCRARSDAGAVCDVLISGSAGVPVSGRRSSIGVTGHSPLRSSRPPVTGLSCPSLEHSGLTSRRR